VSALTSNLDISSTTVAIRRSPLDNEDYTADSGAIKRRVFAEVAGSLYWYQCNPYIELHGLHQYDLGDTQ